MGYERQIFRSDMINCVLCEDAPCKKACGKVECDKALRSIWFDNESGAAAKLSETFSCDTCDAPCEKACIRQGQVPVKKLMQKLHSLGGEEDFCDHEKVSKLKTHICGIPLENPFLLSSSVVASTYEMCARAFDMGWAGAAFKTISFLDIH